jgi:predicted Zn-dependent protease
MVSTHPTTDMQESEQSRLRFVHAVLPWVLGAVALVLYVLTLNQWVSLTSLPIVAKVGGWDWNTTLTAPLLYLLTYPFRFLPSNWQPIALNVFSAVCGALTLVLLARSVALLPHDRTRDQRQRERSEFSLLSIPTAWLPPVLAVLVCGLQLTFWEHATAITGEALNLLLFAYVVRCLLEYRVDQRESWLTRMAFVYGVAITNNWAMLGFLPVLLVALVWILGVRFFEFRFLTRMVVFGSLGLLFYLVVPLVEVQTGDSPLSFWQLFKRQLATQKSILMFRPLRTRALVCGLTSILPLLMIGIRWPSSSGDTSVAGNVLTNVMFKLVHAIFLIACVWVAFDPNFSPRSLGLGLPFLTFYYLGALSVGYFVGYFLLVFGHEPERKSRRRSAPLVRFANGLVVALIWVALVGIPAGLIYRNLSVIKAENGQLLEKLVASESQHLPPNGGLVLSDEASSLLLLEGYLRKKGGHHPYLLLNTDLLQYHAYHRSLQTRYASRFPKLPLDKLPEPIDSLSLLTMVYSLGQSNQMFYLQPSFGYYFEYFYLVPKGVLYELKEYPPEQITVPPLTAEAIAQNQQFWGGIQEDTRRLRSLAARKLPDAENLGRMYSRAANFWGVQLQRNNHAKEAEEFFTRAQDLSSENVAAALNLKYNTTPAAQKAQPVQLEQSIQDRLASYRDVVSFLRACGPVDEPGLCMYLGQDFMKNSLYRQAAQQFIRVKELQPANTEASLWLANTYLQGQRPDKVIEVVKEVQQAAPSNSLSLTNQLDLIRLEAWAQFHLTNFAKAKEILLHNQKKYQQLSDAWTMISQMYVRQADFTNALEALDNQLRLTPSDTTALLNKSAVYIQMTNYAAALPLLDTILARDPNHVGSLINRGLAHFQNGQLDAAQRDYETLGKVLPNYSLVDFRLAEIAERRGDRANALVKYRTFLKRAASDVPERTTAQEKLKQLEQGLASSR